MINTLGSLVRSRISLLVVLVAGLFPQVADAEMVTVVNNTSWPVVVQASVLIRGVPRRDRPYQVLPGAQVMLNLPVGDRILTVTDARNPNRTLLQSILPNSLVNQAWSLNPDGPPPGVRLDLQTTQVPSR